MVNSSDILNFWFKEGTRQQWWSKNEAFDALIKEQYSEVHYQATQNELYSWRSDASGRLAEIIILDQFSRNMFRDSPQAFAQDAQALTLAQEAIAQGFNHTLSPEERSFLYMPYMHSESLAIHEEAIKLFSQPGLEHNLDFELKHKKIIDEFGRYPHRNTVLGRQSTPEEIAFLKQPRSSF